MRCVVEATRVPCWRRKGWAEALISGACAHGKLILTILIIFGSPARSPMINSVYTLAKIRQARPQYILESTQPNQSRLEHCQAFFLRRCSLGAGHLVVNSKPMICAARLYLDSRFNVLYRNLWRSSRRGLTSTDVIIFSTYLFYLGRRNVSTKTSASFIFAVWPS